VTDESSEQEQPHAARIQSERQRKSNKRLPADSEYDWPANLNALLEWHARETEDVMRAAQMRMHAATKLVTDCASGKVSLEETAKRFFGEYDSRWGDPFPKGIVETRNLTDKEIYRRMDERIKDRSR
jgi:hypothetical protein